jgi:hypothetical protein
VREIWSVTLSEEYKFRVFENKVLGRTYGHRREEMSRCWRRLNNELHKFHASPHIKMIKRRRMRFVGYVADIGETKMHAKLRKT